MHKINIQRHAGFYPFNPNLGQVMQTGVPGTSCDFGFIAHLAWTALQAVVADVDGLKAATAVSSDSATTLVPTTQPLCPKSITLTAAGTAGSIKAVQGKVYGTSYLGLEITEDLPAFTVDTAGTVEGSKAFASVSKVEIPAMDGAGVTIAIGFGEKLGLPFKLSHNTLLKTYLNHVLEANASTVATSATAIESNTIDLDSALDGSVVDAYFIV